MKKKLLLIVGMFLLLATGLYAQSVVVNKVLNNTAAALGGGINGQGDGVELLVLDDHVDLRGAYIKDFNGMGTGSAAFIEGSQFQFTQNALWSDLRSGTTITLIRPAISPIAAPVVDVDASDFTILLALGGTSSTDYIAQVTTNNTFTFNVQGTDGIVLKRGTSPNGMDNVIHFFFTGYGGNATLKTLIDSYTFPKMLSTTTMVGTVAGTNPGYSGFAFANNPSGATTAALAKADYNGLDGPTNNILEMFINTATDDRAPAWGTGETEKGKTLITALREASDAIPDVVINTVFNSGVTAGDAIELLVIRDHMDMRGMYIKDIVGGTSTGTTFNDTGGKYQFTQNDLWKDLRKGTTIVMRAAAVGVTVAGADLDTAGHTLDINILSAASSSYLSYISGSFNLQNYDMVVLKAAGSTGGADGYVGAVHIFVSGVATSYTTAYNALPEPKLGTVSILNGNTTSTGFQYPLNATKSGADFNGLGTGFVTNVSNGTPAWGIGEAGNNAAYIASLRPSDVVLVPPAIFGGVVVNRVFNSGTTTGDGDMVELLVIRDATDLRGVYFKDISGDVSTATSYNDNGGKYQFSQDAIWANLSKGTTIVIRVSGAGITDDGYDPDAKDSRIDVNLLYQKSSKYFDYLSGTFNLQNYDMVVLKAAGSTGGANGYEGSLHIFAFGVTSSYLPSFNALPTPKVGSATALSSTSGYQYVNSQTMSIEDFNGFGTNVTNTTSTETVWGDGHPGANADFIKSLRPTTTVGDGPSVVINRIFNSSTVISAPTTTGGVDDVVELLVIQDHTDMRGMFIKDIGGGTNVSTTFSDAGGKYQFTENALWSDLRSGTTIVLRGVAATVIEAGVDLDPSDYRLDLNLIASDYFLNLGTATAFNLQNYDMVMLKTRESGATGFTGVIHSFVTGISNATKITLFNTLPSPKLGSATLLNGNSTSPGYQYALNPTQSPSDFNGRGATYVGNSTTLIPVWGNGHPGNNADYIASLRPVIANQPVIKSGQDYTVDENSPAGTVVGKASATLKSTGTLSKWAILYGNTNNMFVIDPSSGVITLTGTSSPDFETMPAYTLTLEVYNGSVRSNSVPIIVNVNNLDEELIAPKITGAVNGRLNGFMPEVTGSAEYNRNISLFVDDVLMTDTLTTNATRAIWSGRIYNALSPGMHTFYFTSSGTGAVLKTSPVTTVNLALETTTIVPYNLLTPNGDGKNDVWKITNLELYPINEVTVFDKVGNIVYKQSNYQQDWDGTSNGTVLNSGTYYYQVSFGPDLKPLKGYLTIIRRK